MLIFSKYDFMKEQKFDEWIQWAESTDDLGVANVEPVLCEFLKYTVNESNPMFEGKTWNGINWENISNDYRNMLEVLLMRNPTNYTYYVLLARSIRKFDYGGIDPSLLEDALNYVPKDHWKWFCNEYIKSNESKEAMTAQDGFKRMIWVRRALIYMVRLYIPNDAPAKAINDYLVLNGLLPVS